MLSWDDRFSEPTGQHTLGLTLTNRSTSGCYLFGYPGISLIDERGRVLPLIYSRTGDQVVTASPPTRADIPPGGVAFVTTNKYRCDVREVMRAAAVRLIPPDDFVALSVSITGNVPMDYCGPGDPGSILHISPVELAEGATIAAP